MSKVALVTGASGQDGSYLSELLLSKGYEVHGVVRRVALEDSKHRLSRINHLSLRLHAGSLENYASLYNIVEKVQPDEVYHLGAQSFVSYSFEDGFSTIQTNINGTYNILEAVRERKPDAKFYFAASSEMFGKVHETPQTEKTPLHPRSPYGISKVFGFNMTRHYREAYGIHASSGILFNHESPRRGYEFVTRKITSTVANIKKGLEKELVLGNLDAQRDWGHSRDYVEAMHMMLQKKSADDYVIATGETHSVREFVDEAFRTVGLDYQKYVKTDPKFFRPAEVNLLLGDYSKAKRVLGWKPKTAFKQLVQEMVEADLKCK